MVTCDQQENVASSQKVLLQFFLQIKKLILTLMALSF